jgi:hypothetical protein
VRDFMDCVVLTVLCLVLTALGAMLFAMWSAPNYDGWPVVVVEGAVTTLWFVGTVTAWVATIGVWRDGE